MKLIWKPFGLEPKSIIMSDEKVLLSSSKTQNDNHYNGLSWYSSKSSDLKNDAFYVRKRFTSNPIGLCQTPISWNTGGKVTLGGARECATIIETNERKNRRLSLDWRVLQKWCVEKAFEVFICDQRCDRVEFCSNK